MLKFGPLLQSLEKFLRQLPGVVLQRIEPALNLVYLPALLISFPLCLFWLFHTPSPGVAIGALGAAGVLVALKGEHVEAGHKFLWAVITLLLLVIEVTAINEERTAQFQEHLHDLEQQRVAQAQTLLQILLTSQDQMSQNQAHFDATASELNETIAQITGGDSYIYLVPTRGPDPLTSFAVFLHGKHPFFADYVDVYDSSAFHVRAHMATLGVVASAPLRTYYPGWAYHLPLSIPVTSERTQAFESRIYGRTAFIQEFMQLYQTPAGWSISYELHTRKGLTIKYADPDFPKDFRLEPPK
jgi:hypothetical protein